jgi:hypothetical protein
MAARGRSLPEPARWRQRRFPLPGAIRKREGEAPAAPAVQRLVDPHHPIGLKKARIPQRASINRLEAEARDQSRLPAAPWAVSIPMSWPITNIPGKKNLISFCTIY